MQKTLIALFCFAFISMNTYSQNWDINLLSDINPQNPSSSLWQKTSSSCYAISTAVPASQLIAGWIKKDKALQRQGWETAGSLVVTIAIAQGLKYTFNRDRPYTKYPTLIYPYDNTEVDKSFPSGHTSTAFSIATSLSLQYKKWYVVVPAYAWATGVGYSRLYLGEHYPSDVIAGAFVGAGSAWLCHWLNKKYFTKKK